MYKQIKYEFHGVLEKIYFHILKLYYNKEENDPLSRFSMLHNILKISTLVQAINHWGEQVADRCWIENKHISLLDKDSLASFIQYCTEQICKFTLMNTV